MGIDKEHKSDSETEVSSTEERVRKGEQLAEQNKTKKAKTCPYTGCGKVYKGNTLVYFKKHVKTCTFKNQVELGYWVAKTSRKYDFDMVNS